MRCITQASKERKVNPFLFWTCNNFPFLGVEEAARRGSTNTCLVWFVVFFFFDLSPPSLLLFWFVLVLVL